MPSAILHYDYVAGKSLLYVNKCNVNVNKGKELLVGLDVGDNNCMWVEDSSARHCGCMTYGSIATAAC